MINIVLFGPPGAGKGTQAENLKTKFELVHISTGDLLRSEKKAETPLGLEAKKFMDAGNLVPDEVVTGMVENFVKANENANGFIFDGYPRTTDQAGDLDRILQNAGTSISVMLSLEVDDDELMRRLLIRGKDSGRADDQDPQIIRNRIKVYNEETAPLIEYYSDQNKYRAVQGVGAIEEIFQSLAEEVEKIK